MARGEYERIQVLLGARDFSASLDVDNTAIPGVLILAGSLLERRITDFTIWNSDGVNAATVTFYDQDGNRKYQITLAADEVAVISLNSAVVYRQNEDIFARTSVALDASISISGKESEPWV